MPGWMYDEEHEGVAHFRVGGEVGVGIEEGFQGLGRDEGCGDGAGGVTAVREDDGDTGGMAVARQDDEDAGSTTEWLQQLLDAARTDENHESSSSPGIEYASDDVIDHADNTDVTSDTDGTDFLVSSPCGRFSDQVVAPILSPTPKQFKGSRHFHVQKRTSPYRRPAPRVSSSGSSSSKTFTSTNAIALDQLQRLERSPSRTWSDEERVFLCTLFTAFELDIRLYTELFNLYFSTKVLESRVRSQLGHLRVFQRAFQSIWSKAEDAQTELLSWISNTQFADQLKPRETAMSLGFNRRASDRTKSRLQAMLALKRSPGVPSSSPPLDVLPNDVEDSQEMIVDVESPTAPVGKSPTPARSLQQLQNVPHQNVPRQNVSHQDVPRIAFRCWDEESWTSYSEKGFVPSFFASECWNQNVATPDLDVLDSSTLDLFFLAHLSKTSGMLSPFVSLTSSLLQCLTYAASKKNPFFAVVDLSKVNPSNLIYCKDVLQRLKGCSQAQWARYRGTAEYIVYGTIPPTAIIAVTSFQQLQKSTIGFDCINPGQTCKQTASLLNKKGNELTPTMSMEIAKLAKEMLGNDIGSRFTPESLSSIVPNMIEKIVDAFKIRIPAGLPKEEMACNRMCFSKILLGNHTSVDVEDAFERGVELGVQTMEFYLRKPNERRVTA